MAKQIPTIQLNDLQMGTLHALVKQEVNGVISGDHVAIYKTNVINALVRHGALRVYRVKNFKIIKANFALRAPIKPRTPKAAIQLAA